MGASTSYGRYDKERMTNATKPDPWTDLANAVVAQAADDYRRLCNKKVKHGVTMAEYEMSIIDGELRSIEGFFRSDWGYLLSHGLAPVIHAKLKSEYEEPMKEMFVRREKWLADQNQKRRLNHETKEATLSAETEG